MPPGVFRRTITVPAPRLRASATRLISEARVNSLISPSRPTMTAEESEGWVEGAVAGAVGGCCAWTLIAIVSATRRAPRMRRLGLTTSIFYSVFRQIDNGRALEVRAIFRHENLPHLNPLREGDGTRSSSRCGDGSTTARWSAQKLSNV